MLLDEPTEPGLPQRVVADLSHADQCNAVTGCGADRSIGSNKLGLPVREAQRLRVGDDDLMPPIRTGISSTNRDAVGEPNGGFMNTHPNHGWRKPSCFLV
jgi:hypothetical protein